MGFLGDMFGGGDKGPIYPAAPVQEDANKKAAALLQDQRMAMLNAGGITDMTGGLGVLLGGGLEKPSFIPV